MESILLFLSFFFLITYIFGRLIEKIHVPWIFASLILGAILSIHNPFTAITDSSTFDFLSNLGMFFLLFIIGFEIDIKKIFTHDSFVLRSSFVMIFFEVLCGTIFLLFFFKLPLFIAVLVSTTFATVGEAILVPILDEFGLMKTKLGQTIVGAGIIDDFLEILVITISIGLVSTSIGYSHLSISFSVLLMLLCVILTGILVAFHKKIPTFKFKDIPSFLLLALFLILLFVSIGALVEASSLGAILAGIALRNVVSGKNIFQFDREMRTISYGFLAPIFLFKIGLSLNFSYLLETYWLVLGIILVTGFAKVASAILVGRKKFGVRKSIFVGTCLTVKLSTSVIVLKILLDQNIITSELYSVLIASSICFTVIVPVLLPKLAEFANLKRKMLV